MPKVENNEIIPLLRKLAKFLENESGYSIKDLEEAKTLATKLYVMHSNRDISLNKDDFNLVLNIVEFDNQSDEK